MNWKNNIYCFFIVLFLLSCKKEDSITEPAPIRIPVWVENKITQPVPEWGSSTRLNLPVQLNQIVLGSSGGIGGFGAHLGGHPEGLDHVWITVLSGIPIKSWGDGKVTRIENMGSEYFITIEYNGGLIGKHMEVKTPLVSVGTTVKEGDPVAYGITYGGMQSAEFMLQDKNRNDGVVDNNTASYVSPFDYLKPDIKSALEERYINEVITPYLSKGLSAGNNQPAEPYLTNKVLIHKDNKKTVAGEWLLKSIKWAEDNIPDMLILLDINNPYFVGKKLIAADDKGEGKHILNGTWSVDTLQHHIIFYSDGKKYFGLYELSESSGRTSLKLEYNTISYPDKFSTNHLVYTERAPTPRRIDAEALGVY